MTDAALPPVNHAPAAPSSELQVACLCAGWCTTCDAWRPIFNAATAAHPAWRFGWIDIEDQADVLGDAPDIDNFPTLMLLRRGEPVFFGAVLPQAGLLQRLLAQAASGGLAPLTDPASRELGRTVARLLVDPLDLGAQPSPD